MILQWLVIISTSYFKCLCGMTTALFTPPD